MAREKFKTLTEQMFYILLCLQEECRGMDIWNGTDADRWPRHHRLRHTL